jgi:colanic acid biosynthesis glycosyl transferase WcaI
MKILLLNQFFWPDSSATSQLLTDLARSLAAEGHEVTAISSDSGGYAVSASNRDTPPVSIHRVKALPFVRGTLGRLLSYLSFYVSAAARGLLLPKQDLVLTLTTPPLLSLLGTLIKAVRGSRHFIWEMDVYPDVAVDLAYFKAGGFADRVIGAFADYSRRFADGIIALGECMKDRLVGRGIPQERIFVADNWADGSAIQPLARVSSADQLVLLYSGNLGLAHDLSTITSSIASLKDDSRFHFLFVGSGGRRAELSAFVEERGIRSVELRPYVQRQSLSESLSAGDIGLVTQRDACCGSVVPSKVYGLLAAGRPVLFIGPAAATPARIIARFACGWHIDVGDDGQLTALLQHLADHPEEVQRAGLAARRALLEHFDLPHGVERILTVLGAHRSLSLLSPFAPLPVRSANSAS